jgi:hypothetical protein
MKIMKEFPFLEDNLSSVFSSFSLSLIDFYLNLKKRRKKG